MWNYYSYEWDDHSGVIRLRAQWINGYECLAWDFSFLVFAKVLYFSENIQWILNVKVNLCNFCAHLKSMNLHFWAENRNLSAIEFLITKWYSYKISEFFGTFFINIQCIYYLSRNLSKLMKTIHIHFREFVVFAHSIPVA